MALAALLPRGPMLPFVFLLVLRFLFGMFQAGGFPTLGRVVADWMPLDGARQCPGSHLDVQPMGRRADPVPPGLALPGLRELARFPFLLIAGLGLVWCGAFWPWFRDRPEEMPQVNRGELKIIDRGRPKPHGPECRSRALAQDGWARSSVWSFCLMYGFTGFSGNFFTSMLPLYLTSTGTSPTATGRLALGAAAGRRVGGLHPGRHRVRLGDPPLWQIASGAAGTSGWSAWAWPARRSWRSTGPRASGCSACS